jgi:hypothetical protein
VNPDDILGYNVDTLRWLQSKAATNFNTTFVIEYVRPAQPRAAAAAATARGHAAGGAPSASRPRISLSPAPARPPPRAAPPPGVP